jgi:hypothetical protein
MTPLLHRDIQALHTKHCSYYHPCSACYNDRQSLKIGDISVAQDDRRYTQVSLEYGGAVCGGAGIGGVW